MQLRNASSVSEFIAAVEGITASSAVHATTMQLWYRGQSSDWPLLPSLYRQSTPVDARFERPIAVRAAHSSARLARQLGTFTVHGVSRAALESIPTVAEAALLARIVIPRQECAAVKRELYTLGFRRGSLFPDLDGLAQDIRYRYSKEYWHADSASDPFSATAPGAPTAHEPGATIGFSADQIRQMASMTSPGFVVPQSLLLESPLVSAPGSHADAAELARRVAHELVIKLKVVNQAELDQGIRDGNLARRLEKQISAAYAEYERRVAHDVRSSGNFFREELIAVLTEGKPWLLE